MMAQLRAWCTLAGLVALAIGLAWVWKYGLADDGLITLLAGAGLSAAGLNIRPRSSRPDPNSIPDGRTQAQGELDQAGFKQETVHRGDPARDPATGKTDQPEGADPAARISLTPKVNISERTPDPAGRESDQDFYKRMTQK